MGNCIFLHLVSINKSVVLNRLILMLLIGLGASIANFASASPIDSLKLVEEDNKWFVVHRVDPKETIYSLSRRYNTPMDEIARYNPEVMSGLKVGVILQIPFKKKTKVVSGTSHIVKPGETLYAISKLYGISVTDIKKWNELGNNNLAVGQALEVSGEKTQTTASVSKGGKQIHIVQAGEGLFGISRKYNLSVDDLMEMNGLTSTALSLNQELVVGESKSKIVRNELPKGRRTPLPTRINYSPEPPKQFLMDQVKEGGVASLIEGTSGNKNYLALHRTAKVGTIMAIRNEMNNQMVFVRVIGKLPDTGVNDRLIIRVSHAAYDQLKAIDPKFRVELTYVP